MNNTKGPKELSKTVRNMKFMQKFNKSPVEIDKKTFSYYANIYFNKLNSYKK